MASVRHVHDINALLIPVYHTKNWLIFFFVHQAGISRNQLMIALEPEAASLFCKYLPIEKLQGSEGGISAFKPGSRYLVLDAGGKCDGKNHRAIMQLHILINSKNT